MNALVLDSPPDSVRAVNGQLVMKVRVASPWQVTVCARCGTLLFGNTDFWVAPVQHPCPVFCSSCVATTWFNQTFVPMYELTHLRKPYHRFNIVSGVRCNCGAPGTWVYVQHSNSWWICDDCLDASEVVATLAAAP